MKLRRRRQRCRYLTRIETPEGQVPVYLSDISASGAMAEGRLRLVPGTVVAVSLLGTPVDALVVRVGPSGGVGLRFKRPIPAMKRAAICRASASARELVRA